MKRENVLKNRNKQQEHQHFVLQVSHIITAMINPAHNAHPICHILMKNTRSVKVRQLSKVMANKHHQILKELLVFVLRDMYTVEQSTCASLLKHQQILNLFQIKFHKKKRNHNSLLTRKLGILPALQKNLFGMQIFSLVYHVQQGQDGIYNWVYAFNARHKTVSSLLNQNSARITIS